MNGIQFDGRWLCIGTYDRYSENTAPEPDAFWMEVELACQIIPKHNMTQIPNKAVNISLQSLIPFLTQTDFSMEHTSRILLVFILIFNQINYKFDDMKLLRFVAQNVPVCVCCLNLPSYKPLVLENASILKQPKCAYLKLSNIREQ